MRSIVVHTLSLSNLNYYQSNFTMNFRQLYVLGLMLLTSIGAMAQQSYRIEYDVDIVQDEDVDAMAAAMMEDMTMTLYFQGRAARVEMNMTMMQMAMIYNDDEKTALILMDMMGQKIASISEGDDFEAMQEQNGNDQTPEIRETGKTKTIAGYKCYQAFVSQPGQEGETEIWYTKDIVVQNESSNYTYQGLAGFPLQMTVNQNGINMDMIAREVSKSRLDSDLFDVEIPEGYVIQEGMLGAPGGGRN